MHRLIGLLSIGFISVVFLGHATGQSPGEPQLEDVPKSTSPLEDDEAKIRTLQEKIQKLDKRLQICESEEKVRKLETRLQISEDAVHKLQDQTKNLGEIQKNLLGVKTALEEQNKIATAVQNGESNKGKQLEKLVKDSFKVNTKVSFLIGHGPADSVVSGKIVGFQHVGDETVIVVDGGQGKILVRWSSIVAMKPM